MVSVEMNVTAAAGEATGLQTAPTEGRAGRHSLTPLIDARGRGGGASCCSEGGK